MDQYVVLSMYNTSIIAGGVLYAWLPLPRGQKYTVYNKHSKLPGSQRPPGFEEGFLRIIVLCSPNYRPPCVAAGSLEAWVLSN